MASILEMLGRGCVKTCMHQNGTLWGRICVWAEAPDIAAENLLLVPLFVTGESFAGWQSSAWLAEQLRGSWALPNVL